MSDVDDYTRVQFGSMEQAYGELIKIVKALDSRTDQLMTEIKTVLGGNWEGEAANFFESRKAKWDAAEVAMSAALTKAATAVDTANTNYREAERKNMSLWMD